MRLRPATFAAATMMVGLLAALPAFAADHEVKMLNMGGDGQRMVFEPAYLEIEPGDTVTFVATDPSHNSEIIAGMLPEGAEGWKGRINEELSVTFDQEGVYGYKCLPHYAMGMVGVIKVGTDVANLEETRAVRHPGQAAKRMAELLDGIDVASN
ncbi:pseudoazurin [Pararhizobium haloflavum]|uniref:pseudoazurin n=1 Tax=Pararhizobium haloflavum TaxID=2037914 RepID=UPI000C190E53|nr:pseudoazurin [Pararhizobium haloflavum]